MGASRFGYPNINTTKYTNEQNMQNVKAYMFELSDSANQYIERLESEIEGLREEINSIKNQ